MAHGMRGAPAHVKAPPQYDAPMQDVAHTPAAPPTGAPLVGRFFRLRRPEPAADARSLYPRCHCGPDADALWRYLSDGPFPSEQAMARWIEQQAADPQFVAYTVESLEQARPVGMCLYLNIVPAMRRLEIGGIWYAPDHQRTRANTEACHLLMRHAFDDLGYRRVEWKCNALNERSRRAALRLGFTYEGLFRQHMIVKGRNRDTAWFSLLDGEWPSARARLERWLYEPDAAPLGRLATER